MECIIISLLQFYFCETTVIRRNCKHGSNRRNSLTTYMHKLCRIVDDRLKSTLAECFAIVFDRWSVGSTKHVSIFSTFPVRNSLGYDKVLLALSPMGNEESLDANENFQFLVLLLSLFGKSMTNVVAVIRDNCSTNRCRSRRIGPIFVGCHSHRLNLSVQDILA